MPGIKEKVVETLKAIDGAHVSHYGSTGDLVMPAITYYELSNIPSVRCDDKEYMAKAVVVVDIWSGSMDEVETLWEEVVSSMDQAGFIREFSADLFEKKGIKRKNIRFGKYY